MFSNSLEHLLDGRRVSDKCLAHLEFIWWNITVWWLHDVRISLYKVGLNCDQNWILITEISICFFLLKSYKIRAKDFLTFIGIGIWIWIDQSNGVDTGARIFNGFFPCSKTRVQLVLFYYLKIRLKLIIKSKVSFYY